MDIFNKIINDVHASTNRHIHAVGGGTHRSPPRWIDPQPSAGGVTCGVWMMPVRLVGVPLRHRGG
jgi:hypothetical protein